MKKYPEKEPRRKLGNKLLVAFFTEKELISRNITGNPAANIGVLDVAKVKFLRQVIFSKFPAPEPKDVNEYRMWEELVVVLNVYLKNMRYEFNRKAILNVEQNQNQ